MKTVPDKCPFCESPVMVHGGNLLRSSDGGFASYECKTVQDIELSDDEWKRAGQSDACRKREVQLLTKRLDEARERIKRLEECIGAAWMIIANVNEGDWTKQSNYWQEFVVRWKDNDLIPVTHKAKEAKP